MSETQAPPANSDTSLTSRAERAVTQISENSSIRLGLALLIAGGAWAMFGKISSVSDSLNTKIDTNAKVAAEQLDKTSKELSKNLDENFVRKDLFLSQMESLKRELELQIEPIKQRLSELSTSLDSAQKAVRDK